MSRPLLALLGLIALLAALPSAAQDSFVGRPVFSEPKTGLALPPGCLLDANARARIANVDVELWLVECRLQARLWLVRRTTVGYDRSNVARLRFEVLDERPLPGETAVETASVQCAPRNGAASPVAVLGATWKRVNANHLALAGAKSALTVDRRAGKLVDIGLDQIDCTRFLDREEQMRRLQGAPPAATAATPR
jgi:hypothetical protein